MRTGAAVRDGSAPLPAARRRVLDLLSPEEAVDAQHVAGELGLHVSTARFHLDALVAADLAVRERSGASRVGRPRQLYRSVARDESSRDGYRDLAAALVHGLAGEPDGPTLAQRAGRAWAARAATRPTGSAHPVDALVDELDRLGFAPSRAVDDGGVRVEMRACPYLDLAREHAEVTCGLHRGLVEGLLGAPDVGVDLVPFAAHDHCLLRVGR